MTLKDTRKLVREVAEIKEYRGLRQFEKKGRYYIIKCNKRESQYRWPVKRNSWKRKREKKKNNRRAITKQRGRRRIEGTSIIQMNALRQFREGQSGRQFTKRLYEMRLQRTLV